MAGRKKTHVQSGNRTRSRSPTRSKQASKPPSKGGKQQQQQQQQQQTKSSTATITTTTTDEDETAAQPKDQPSRKQITAHQQKLLGTFQGTFEAVLTSGTFNAILQEVKSALFKRDFAVAFGTEQFLEAYAARWSPTRALCYASALDGISSYLEALALPVAEDSEHATLQVLAFGGAAAELVAFASYLSRQSSKLVSGAITLVDIAPWGGVVAKLREGLETPPPLSKYASAAMRAANTPVNEEGRLRDVVFKERDVFALDRAGLAELVPSGGAPQQPVLATLLFTLNELFTGGGIGKTTTFLLTLTSQLPTGSLLLVIDSPGSYSETTLGKEAKRYPMAWLLDKILQGAADEEDEDSEKWEKVESTDSAWFRLGNDLRYPIPLEDMRYQMHLYRKGADGGVGEEVEE
ncbi:unnamed protein product [Discula destructiva]